MSEPTVGDWVREPGGEPFHVYGACDGYVDVPGVPHCVAGNTLERAIRRPPEELEAGDLVLLGDVWKEVSKMEGSNIAIGGYWEDRTILTRDYPNGLWCFPAKKEPTQVVVRLAPGEVWAAAGFCALSNDTDRPLEVTVVQK